MVSAVSCVPHIEAFVNASYPTHQQNGGVDEVTALLKNDVVTIEALVREMDLYLTTTDDSIRARGILFLAEILTRLSSKPLDSSTLSSLVGFFSSRLADWPAFRGALIGCLGLLRRKENAGTVVDIDARKLAQSLLDNVQVQLLAMQDRKLCFEVYQHLLDVYVDSLAALGDDFVYGLIQAVDQEKDPRCLVLAFRIVQSLVQSFPLQLDSGNLAEDIFETLSCYFPIYFTHKMGDDFEIKREDLSDALMHTFCSTPYFEPFVIPLILDKLSSSLPIAKIDSLKYLKNCMLSYGADRMLQHAQHIWFSLKDVIFNLPPQLEALSLTPDLGRDIKSDEHEIATEALTCLKAIILLFTCPDGDKFLSLIINDKDIEESFTSVTMEGKHFDSPDKTSSLLSALSSILSVTANASGFCCGGVFQTFFPRLMTILEVPTKSSEFFPDAVTKVASRKLNYGALYLCVRLLTSCRDLTATTWESSAEMETLQDSWWYLIQDISGPLTSTFKSVLEIPDIVVAESAYLNEEHVFCCVKGLQVLATYPGQFSPITKDVFEDILAAFMSVITGSSVDTYLWKLSLKSLAMIGISITKFNDSDKQMIYSKIVVKPLVFLLLHEDSTSSIAPALEAASEIGICGLDYMLQIIQGFEDAIFSNFMQACVDGNHKSIKALVLLLDCYCNKLLLWCHNSGNFEEPGMSFAIGILEWMENIIDIRIEPQMRDLLDRMMMTMKLVVRGCTKGNQHKILRKAYDILQASGCFSLESIPPSIFELSQFTQDVSELTCKNKWLLYFIASIVMALHQRTRVPDGEKLLSLFLVFLLKGHLTAAQALASLINKWPTCFDKLGISNAYTLDETIDILMRLFSTILFDSPARTITLMNSYEGTFTQFVSHLQIHAVIGLGWIGKALLMRGHDRLKDIVMILLKCLLLCENEIPSYPSDGSVNCNGQDMRYLVARSAADAFHVLLSDSEICLSKNFHAIIKPLYKQRFFSSMIPILHTSIKDCNSLRTRTLLYQAFGHIVREVPLVVLIAETKKVMPLLLEALSVLDVDVMNKDLLYSLLLVLSGFLMDEKGNEGITDYVHTVMNHLIKLISYPHMMLVRETAIQCLVAVTGLSYTRIYPMRAKVLRALSGALDDKKRSVRQESVKCYHAWASMASRSLR